MKKPKDTFVEYWGGVLHALLQLQQTGRVQKPWFTRWCIQLFNHCSDRSDWSFDISPHGSLLFTKLQLWTAAARLDLIKRWTVCQHLLSSPTALCCRQGKWENGAGSSWSRSLNWGIQDFTETDTLLVFVFTTGTCRHLHYAASGHIYNSRAKSVSLLVNFSSRNATDAQIQHCASLSAAQGTIKSHLFVRF